MAKTALITLSLVLFLSLEINCQEAALHVSHGPSNKEYCLVYNSTWANLSDSLSTAVEYQSVNLTSSLLCSGAGVSPDLVKGKVLVVMRGECTFVQKALVAQQLGAVALLVASTTAMSPPGTNGSEYENVHIPVALMRYRDFLDAQQLFGDGMLVKMYAQRAAVLDASILVMLAIAIFTVAMGGYWSGACERARLSQGPSVGGGGEEKTDSGDLSLYSPLKVVIFVALMCVMLVLMYFFYKWLVYVIIAIFCLASATALFSCLDAVMDAIGCGTKNFTVREKTLSLRSLLLAAVCISVSVVWAVYRNEDRWIWILQDVLGIVFCLNFMKTITLSNFKICVILLGLLLVYDVFFVFITPFFTKNGQSIMVQVALGPDAAGEKGNTLEVSADPTAPYEKKELLTIPPGEKNAEFN